MKLARHKELAPCDDNWFYTRAGWLFPIHHSTQTFQIYSNLKYKGYRNHYVWLSFYRIYHPIVVILTDLLVFQDLHNVYSKTQSLVLMRMLSTRTYQPKRKNVRRVINWNVGVLTVQVKKSHVFIATCSIKNVRVTSVHSPPPLPARRRGCGLHDQDLRRASVEWRVPRPR